MLFRIIPKRLYKINTLIVLILFLLGFSVFYFLYHRVRNQAIVYVLVSAIRQGGSEWIPYWQGNYIKVGDKERNPLGVEVVEIVDKREYPSGGSGSNIYLLLKIQATKDKSGVYLYKNKPLLVGSNIDLKLMTVGIGGSIRYIGETPPAYEEKRIKITVYGKAVDSWIADNVKIGSQIVDSHGNVITKIISKKVSIPASISILARDEVSKKYVMINEFGKKDLVLTIEILVKKIEGNYFYIESQPIKIDEPISLILPEVSLENMRITEILVQ